MFVCSYVYCFYILTFRATFSADLYAGEFLRKVTYGDELICWKVKYEQSFADYHFHINISTSLLDPRMILPFERVFTFLSENKILRDLKTGEVINIPYLRYSNPWDVWEISYTGISKAYFKKINKLQEFPVQF